MRQLVRQGRQRIEATVGPAQLEGEAAPFDVATLAQAAADGRQQLGRWCARAKESDAGDLCGLLRKRGDGWGEETTRECADEPTPVDQ
jgi:hypothetical protein